jgi:hypothetical protein
MTIDDLKVLDSRESKESTEIQRSSYKNSFKSTYSKNYKEKESVLKRLLVNETSQASKPVTTVNSRFRGIYQIKIPLPSVKLSSSPIKENVEQSNLLLLESSVPVEDLEEVKGIEGSDDKIRLPSILHSRIINCPFGVNVNRYPTGHIRRNKKNLAIVKV